MFRALIAGTDGQTPDEMALIALALAGAALLALMSAIGLTIYAVLAQHAAWASMMGGYGEVVAGVIAAPASAISALATAMGFKSRQEKS